MNGIVEMDVASARRLTERIRLMAMTVGDNITKLKSLVAEAKESKVHVALGYPSWTAYLADVLGDTPMRLEREVRQALVAELSEQGMSTRAIAPIVGVGMTTVKRDIAGGPNGPRDDVPPVLSDEPGHVTKLTGSGSAAVNVTPDLAPRIDDWVQPGEVLNPATGEVTEPPTVREVTGLDGKTYSTPVAPHKPQRKALTDTAKDVGWELRKATEKLQRIRDDDRFSRNKNEVAAHIRGHLMFTVEVCQDLLDVLNQS